MHRAYFTLSVCIILLGLAHIAATPRYFPAFTSTSVWFASGGLAIILALRVFQWDPTLAGLRSSFPQKNRMRIR